MTRSYEVLALLNSKLVTVVILSVSSCEMPGGKVVVTIFELFSQWKTKLASAKIKNYSIHLIARTSWLHYDRLRQGWGTCGSRATCGPLKF